MDASVVAKWFIPEHDSDRALRVRDSHAAGDINLVAPDLLVYEVANTLRYRRDFKEEAVIECVSILCAFGMELEVPGPREISRAIAEAISRDLSVYDGIYISIAKKYATKVVTADAKLHLAGGGDDTLLLQDLGSMWDLPYATAAGDGPARGGEG